MYSWNSIRECQIKKQPQQMSLHKWPVRQNINCFKHIKTGLYSTSQEKPAKKEFYWWFLMNYILKNPLIRDMHNTTWQRKVGRSRNLYIPHFIQFHNAKAAGYLKEMWTLQCLQNVFGYPTLYNLPHSNQGEYQFSEIPLSGWTGYFLQCILRWISPHNVAHSGFLAYITSQT